MTKILKSLAVLMLVGLLTSAYAQVPKKPTTTSGFPHQDIATIAARIIAVQKSEFESTEQYQARLEKVTGGTREVTFLLNIGSNDGDVANFKYDADNQKLLVEIWGVEPWLLHTDGETHPAFQLPISRRNISRRSYVGSNAYGAKASVSSEENNEYGLALNKSEWISSYSTTTLSLPMTPADARAIKPYLRLAVVCNMTTTLYTDTMYGTATLQNPHEHTTHQFYFPAVIQRFVVFDVRTGKEVGTVTSNN